MRHPRAICTLLLASLSFAGRLAASDPETPATGSRTIKSTFLISGLHCPPCATTVERSLQGVKGVRSVKVEWTTKNARVEFDESIVTPQQLATHLAATPHMMGGNMRYAGWLALKVPGVDAASAGDKARSTLMQVKGVSAVAVYPQQSAVGVAFAKDGKATTADLLDALKNAGFEATLYP